MVTITGQSFIGGTLMPSDSVVYTGCSFTGVTFNGGKLLLAGGSKLIRCRGELAGLLMYVQDGLEPNAIDNSLVTVSGDATIDGIDLETSGLSVQGTLYSNWSRVLVRGTGSLVGGDGSWLVHKSRSEALAVELTGLTPETLELYKGGEGVQLSPLMSDMMNDPGRCTWSSSDVSVASVDLSGRVSPVGTGSCTVSASFGGSTLSTSVTVKSLVVFASTKAGLKRTRDMRTWTTVCSYSGILSYAGGVLFISDGGPCYYSTDLGDSWQVVPYENSETTNRRDTGYRHTSGRVAYTHGYWVHPMTYLHSPGYDMCMGISRDLKNWYIRPTLLPTSSATSATEGSLSFIGTSFGVAAIGGMTATKYISTYDAPFTNVLSGRLAGTSVEESNGYKIAVLRTEDGKTFYEDIKAPAHSSGKQLPVSTDGGSTWRTTTLPHSYGTIIPLKDNLWLIPFAVGGDILEPGTPSLFYISTDQGVSWAEADEVLVDLGIPGDPSGLIYYVLPYLKGTNYTAKIGSSWYIVLDKVSVGIAPPENKDLVGYGFYNALFRLDVDESRRSVTITYDSILNESLGPVDPWSDTVLLSIEPGPVAPLVSPKKEKLSSYSGEAFVALSLYTESATYESLKISYDRGRSWDVMTLGNSMIKSPLLFGTENANTPKLPGGLATYKGVIVACGYLGRAYVVDPSGSVLTVQHPGVTGHLSSIAVSDSGVCIACAREGSVALRSGPGLSEWSAISMPDTTVGWRITYGKGLFVAVSGQKVAVSSDLGITWSSYDLSPLLYIETSSVETGRNFLGSVAFGNGVFVATANGQNPVAGLLTSVDGITWGWSYQNLVYSGTTGVLVVRFDGSYFYVTAQDVYFADRVRSADGYVWEGCSRNEECYFYTYRTFALPGTLLLSAGRGGVESISTDNGKSWTGFTTNPDLGTYKTGGGFSSYEMASLPAGNRIAMKTTMYIQCKASSPTITINGLDPSIEHEIQWGDGQTTTGASSSSTHSALGLTGTHLLAVKLARGRFQDDLSGVTIVGPGSFLYGLSCWGGGFTGVKSLSGTFSGHTGLRFIPDTWNGLESTTNVTDTFRGCRSLCGGSWGGYSGLMSVSSADGMFYGCSGFRGDIGGVYEVLHASGASHSGTFLGCAGATGYASIPAEWKS